MNVSNTSRKHKHQSGFAIILVMVLLVVAGGVAATMMARQDNETVWAPIKGTQHQLASIQEALIAYQRQNHALPAPALRTLEGVTVPGARLHVDATEVFNAITNPETGVPDEVGDVFEGGGKVATPSSSGGVAYVSNSNKPLDEPHTIVLVGAIPCETLGLRRDCAEDRNGRLLTYAVTRDATDPDKFETAEGAIKIENAAHEVVAENVSFVVLAQGKAAHGAWNAKSRIKGRGCDGQMISAPNGKNNEAGSVGGGVSDFMNCSEQSATFITHDVTLAGNQKFDDQLLKGEKDTAALTMSKPCAAQGVSWTHGNNKALGTPACNGDVTAMYHYGSIKAAASQLVTDSTAPTTGAATYRCNNGAVELDSSAPSPTCVATNPPGTCALPWGGTINDGDSVTAWAAATYPCGANGPASETRVCTNGVLSGSFLHPSVTPPVCAGTCALPWGGTINVGDSVTAWAADTYPCGANGPASETRQCVDNGNGTATLTGSFIHPSVTPPVCAATCSLPWGGTINEGQSVTAYNLSVGTCSQNCAQETRQCTRDRNGNLILSGSGFLGSFNHQSCTPATNCGTASCSLPWGGTLAHGDSATFYLNEVLPCGAACEGITRTCNNGVLSGSDAYAAGSCSVIGCGGDDECDASTHIGPLPCPNPRGFYWAPQPDGSNVCTALCGGIGGGGGS